MKTNTKYNFSFTAASALIPETLIVAQEFVQYKDWKKVKSIVWDHNLLNKIKQDTFKREFSEIKKRLSLLTTRQLKILANGNFDEAKDMILLSLLKAYIFLKYFIVEVIRNNYFLYNNILTDSDYFKFFNSKTISHSELNTLTELTIKKVKQVIFKLLEQVNLITQIRNGTIIKPILSNGVMA